MLIPSSQDVMKILNNITFFPSQQTTPKTRESTICENPLRIVIENRGKATGD